MSTSCSIFVITILTPRVSIFFFFLMIRRPPRSTLDRSSAASDVYKRQSLSHLLFLVPVGIAAALVLIKMAPYRLKRLTVFLDPQSDPMGICLLYTSPSPRDRTRSRMPSSA